MAKPTARSLACLSMLTKHVTNAFFRARTRTQLLYPTTPTTPTLLHHIRLTRSTRRSIAGRLDLRGLLKAQ